MSKRSHAEDEHTEGGHAYDRALDRRPPDDKLRRGDDGDDGDANFAPMMTFAFMACHNDITPDISRYDELLNKELEKREAVERPKENRRRRSIGGDLERRPVESPKGNIRFLMR